MKSITIQEKNKLLAEFMGAIHFRNGFEDGKTITLQFPNESRCDIDNLQYHTSFDWLMPIVDKIESMDYETSIYGDKTKGEQYQQKVEICSYDGELLHRSISSSKIEALHQAVYQFIVNIKK